MSKSDRRAVGFFYISAALLIFFYGVAVSRYRIFPYQIFFLAKTGYEELKSRLDKERPWYYRVIDNAEKPGTTGTSKAYQGYNLISEIGANSQLLVKISGMKGELLHQWKIDWFDMWPDATHLPERFKPKSRPGTNVHGTVVMENGDLVFNFEHLGLVRIDWNGKVIWRLPYQTHHTIHRHDNGNLWVCGQKEHTERNNRFLNRVPPFSEYMILEVTPEGRIVYERSVSEILSKNGRTGLLYLGSLHNWNTRVGGDILHLNDVEPFPETLKEGFFKRGDILVSLRNINTVFVYNIKDDKIKFISTGRFVRQHDPDFIDGNTFSVFDNNNISFETENSRSRILIVSAPEEKIAAYFEGNPKNHFYTEIFGQHQWLPNGNLLITESVWGRAFEINQEKEIVWEYTNFIDKGIISIVSDVHRLEPDSVPFLSGIVPDQPESRQVNP